MDAEHESEVKLPEDDLYIALKCELWGVYCKDLFWRKLTMLWWYHMV